MPNKDLLNEWILTPTTIKQSRLEIFQPFSSWKFELNWLLKKSSIDVFAL
jgi:hypothetical protein